MADPTTANIGLAQPTRGSDTGVWDAPMNGNTTLLDLCIGGIATINLNNSNVILSAAQFESEQITCQSTLTGSVTLTFPTSFIKSYVVQNICTGSSAFTVTLQTTAAGGQAIACPPGELFEIRNDGANIKFKNFGRIGSYWDHGGSSVPNWVPACTVPPYLNCDGTTFSSATYPTLAMYLGGNTLPDFRGRGAVYLNQGTGRVTSSQGGVDGNTLAANGGAQTTTLLSSNLPHSIPINDPGHVHAFADGDNPITQSFGAGSTPSNGSDKAPSAMQSAVTGITVNPSSLGTDNPFSNMHPVAVSGLRLIRAA